MVKILNLKKEIINVRIMFHNVMISIKGNFMTSFNVKVIFAMKNEMGHETKLTPYIETCIRIGNNESMAAPNDEL
jgi:hypothetical protein